MNIRRLLLRIMLWLLAASALAGAFAFLVSSSWYIWRTTWTGIVAAIAAGLLIPLSLATDKEKWRPAGLAGMGTVLAEFILMLALIWLDGLSRFSRYDEEILITMVFLFLCGVAGAVALVLMRLDVARSAGITGALGAAVAFVAYLIAIWADGLLRYPADQNLWITAAGVAGYGTIIAFAMTGYRRNENLSLRWVGIACALLGFLTLMIATWGKASEVRTHVVWITTLGILIAHYETVSAATLRDFQIWIRWGTIAMLVLSGILADIFMIRDLHHLPEIEIFGRGAGAALITASCGTLAVIILAAINRRGQYVASSGPIKVITLHCPKCQKKQILPLGDATCQSCGLLIRTAIEWPECPECGYLLFGLTSDRCPECGCYIGTAAQAADTASQE